MPKKIVSYTLSKRNVDRIESTSKALGLSRSELVDLMIERGFHYSGDIKSEVGKISRLQKDTEEKLRKRKR